MTELLFDGVGPARAAAALAVALAFALVVVLLRPLSRRAVVAYGALWERALARGGRGIPWREALALLLFVAALAALTGGIAGPRLATRASRRIAVLLDASASMDARDAAGRRRIDLARIAATRVGRAARPGDAFAIFRVGSRTTPLAPWELASVDVDDTAEDFAAAAAMADTFLAQGAADSERRVVVLSDRAGAFAPPPGGFTRETALDRVPIGSAGENLAVTGLGVSTGSASEGGLDLLVTVANAGAGASDASAELVLHTGTFRLGGARLSVPAGRVVSSAFHLAGTPERELWASLDRIAFASGGADALARDDHRAAWAPDRGAIEVVVVGDRPNRFLDGALAVQSGMHVRRVDSGRATASSLGPADVVVVDGVPTPRGLEGKGVLVLGFAQGRSVEAPVLTDWNGDHPATAKVSLDDLTLASARILAPRPGEVVLAASSQGPIALARTEAGGSRTVTLGFDPSRTDFPLRLSYPVFVGSAVRWLAGVDGDRAPLSVVAGKRDGGSGESLFLVAGVVRVGGRAVEVGMDPGEHALAVEGGTGEPRLPEWIDGTEAVRSRSWTSLLFALAAILLVLKAWAG